MRITKKDLFKHLFLAWFGGSAYLTMEIFYRGCTDKSMFFAGAIAFILVGGLNHWLPWEMPFWAQMLCGGLLITAVELTFGLVLNVWLNLQIWDYSALPLNFMGQICLTYSVIWVGLSAVAILLDDYIRYYFFSEDKPRYYMI